MVYYSNCEEDTQALGKKLGQSAKSGDIYCLTGELGAGKTVFAKGFARGLGIAAQITSPTFTLVNEYDGILPLYHFDAYRLEGADKAFCFDFEEYFLADGVCLIEWAEKIAEIIPKAACLINIEARNGNKRIITIETKGCRNDISH